MSKHRITIGLLAVFAVALFYGWRLEVKKQKAIAITLQGPYKAPVMPFPDSATYLKHFITVQYRGTRKVPPPGIVTIHFHDLYPGDLNWKEGGCAWWDKTQLGATMTLIPGDVEESVKAIPGHTVEYECHWSAPRPHPLEYPVTQ